MLLVNRPKPVLYERLESYLERLRRANHYREPLWYSDLLTPSVPWRMDLLQSPQHYTALQALTGLQGDALYNLTLHRFAESCQPLTYNKDKLHPPMLSGGLPLYVREAYRDAICPCCYAENEALLLPWLLGHAVTCPKHQVLLIDHCSVCAATLRVDLRTGSCRQCGASIADFHTSSIADSATSLYITRLVWNALCCSDEAFPLQGISLASQHPLYLMSANGLLWWLWKGLELIATVDPLNPLFEQRGAFLEQQRISLPTTLRRATIEQGHRMLCAMWQVLYHWPESWDTVVERIIRLETDDNPQTLLFAHRLKQAFRGSEWDWLNNRTLLHYNNLIDIIEDAPALESPVWTSESMRRIEAMLDRIAIIPDH